MRDNGQRRMRRERWQESDDGLHGERIEVLYLGGDGGGERWQGQDLIGDLVSRRITIR